MDLYFMAKIMEVSMVKRMSKFTLKKVPCEKCPYKLGVIKTLVNPCPQCQLNNYRVYEEFKKQIFEK